MIPVVTQPCFHSGFEPISAIMAKGESEKTHNLESIKAALIAVAPEGTTHIFNMKVETYSNFGTCHRATADAWRKIEPEIGYNRL